jgi:hypothetical protein
MTILWQCEICQNGCISTFSKLDIAKTFDSVRWDYYLLAC